MNLEEKARVCVWGGRDKLIKLEMERELNKNM